MGSLRQRWRSAKIPLLQRIDGAFAAPFGLVRPSSGPHLPGADIAGFFSVPSGLGQAARGLAAACASAGMPTHLQEVGARLESVSLRQNAILHMNPESLRPFLYRGGWRMLKSAKRIGYWTWETSRAPSAWKRFAGLFDELWAPSAFAADAVRSVTDVPVEIVPHALLTAARGKRDRAAFGLPEDAFVFLAMADAFSILERKNPLDAIKAFRQAFPRGEAVLVVKISNLPTAHPLRSVIAEARDSGVRLIDGFLPPDRAADLIASCDAFVSLHRGEGFGLAIAEAMAAGKPVIATGYGGNLDYMNAGNGILLPFEHMPLAAHAGPYRKGTVWAQPSLEAAAEAMRNLREDASLRERLGHAAAKVADALSPSAVGERVSSLLRA